MNSIIVNKSNNPKIDARKALKKFKAPKNSRVFIKINLSLDRDYPGTNTKPDLLYEIVRILSKKHEVIAGDSNPSSCNTDKALIVTGNAKAIKEGGGKPINLSKDKKVLVKNNNCHVLKEHWMPESVVNADAVISLALLKTHVFTTMTGTLKNMFGTLPDLKILHHQYLNKAIHDSVILSKPCYGIIDGRIGMEGQGPVEGTPKKAGAIISGENLVSVDAEACKIMGIKPETVKHIMLCNQETKGLKYKQEGIKIRMKFKPAEKGIIDKIQEASLKKQTTINLCYKTPLFKTLKWGAKTIKDIKRWRKR